MDIKIQEFKKLISSPVIIGLTVIFILFNIMSISSSSYFEEDIKGTIKEGKLADLVILDKNPLKVDSDDIRNIKVLETIKEGKTIFKA